MMKIGKDEMLRMTKLIKMNKNHETAEYYKTDEMIDIL